MADGVVGVRQATTPDRLIDNSVLVSASGATVYRQRVESLPSMQRTLFDYASRTDGNPVYVGLNEMSVATAAASWLVLRFTYDSSGRATDKQVLVGAWDSRATLLWT